MSAKTFRIIAAVAAGLVLLLVVLRSLDDGGAPSDGRLLLSDFATVANDVSEIRIAGPGEPPGVTLRRKEDQWVVVERNDYPADLGQLRQLVIALSEAAIIEEKTSNPEYYERLGLGDTSGEGGGVTVTAVGDGFESTVVFGNTAQGDFRYARTPDQPASYLVNRNPELPLVPDDWLDPVIVDVPASDVRLVTLEHADGERVELAKPDRESPAEEEGETEPAISPNFIAVNLPEGREFTYPSVGDSIAGALAGLQLDDVRPATEAEAAGRASFETGAGVVVDVTVIEETVPAAPAADEHAAENGDEAESTDDSDAEETETWLRFSASAGESAGEEAAAGAKAINDRVSGWEYRVSDYKVQLLTKRWEDLLKPAE